MRPSSPLLCQAGWTEKDMNTMSHKSDGEHTPASGIVAVVIGVMIVLVILSMAGVGAGAVAVLVWTGSLVAGASEPMALAAALAIVFVSACGCWTISTSSMGWAQEIFAAVMGALGHGDATYPRA